MAARKITLLEAARIKAAAYAFIQENPGVYRHQVVDEFKLVPTDVLAKQLRALAAEGKIRQLDPRGGQSPYSRIYPTVEKRNTPAAGEYGRGLSDGFAGTRTTRNPSHYPSAQP